MKFVQNDRIMYTEKVEAISGFFVAGVSYKNANAASRGQFAVNSEQYEAILNDAPRHGLTALFILSTCNRTEIYGFAHNVDQLIRLLCTQTKGDAISFYGKAYAHTGNSAIMHLFNVGSGLDSQLLGDYEITGQLKKAVKFSKDRGFINGFLERLVNTVLQASKLIKNETVLSGGSVSVSASVVKYILAHSQSLNSQKILVLGTGQMGSNVCKSLVKRLGTTAITVMNRTEGTAVKLAAELGLAHAPQTQLAGRLADSEVIIVATSAPKPTILRSHLQFHSDKLIIDLSIPCNVEASVKELPDGGWSAWMNCKK